jgi:hypothetical protein
MKATKGKANPQQVNDLLKKKLGDSTGMPKFADFLHGGQFALAAFHAVERDDHRRQGSAPAARISRRIRAPRCRRRSRRR